MTGQGRVTVLSSTPLTRSVTRLTLDAPQIAASAAPGQFVHIKCGSDTLLRRPISICDVNGSQITLIVEKRGDGSRWLTAREPSDTLDMLGPLGHGFTLDFKRPLIVGGGVGTAPLVFAARQRPGTSAVLGYRDAASAILKDDYDALCSAVYITTDDGSAGEQGTVAGPTARLLASGEFDGVIACGPRPMLRAVADLAKQYSVPCQVSLEERMGCGVGACLVCACKTTENDGAHMRRVCKDGPVFNAEEVDW